MEAQNFKLLEDSKGALVKCRKALEKISTTCCVAERSPNMNEAFIELDSIFQSIGHSSLDQKQYYSAIDGIGQFGSKIGWLYATCCSETREPMYQSIFKELNFAHANFWRILSIEH